MKKEDRKKLVTEYLNTKPDMGIIYLYCKNTEEYYIDISTNIRANLNRNIAQLGFNAHPNKQLQSLWESYGQSSFEYGVLAQLEYDEKQPDKNDYTEELEELFNKKMTELKGAKKIR